MTKAVNPLSQQHEAVERKGGATSAFKYYIHDTTEGYRLQLLGDFTDHQVSELNCCWMTAKDTLRGRKLILDLRGIGRVDERGKQWLAGMALEGASYVPESFLRDALAGDTEELASASRNQCRLNFFERVVGVFRGSVPSTE